VADCHAQNWDVSESELETFAKGGVFDGFYQWVTRPFVKGSYTTNHFKEFDHDKEGSLGMAELYCAMYAYLGQGRAPISWEEANTVFPPQEQQAATTTVDEVICEADVELLARHFMRKADHTGSLSCLAPPSHPSPRRPWPALPA
jgi:hypothetical protein